jgi:ribulose-5-phosphate 4-epimerase/fuculose-1-phosphate aldolase
MAALPLTARPDRRAAVNADADTITTDVRSHVSDEEWRIRVDLAAAYRLVAHYGWDDLVFTHISARIPGPEHHFLVNPYGMLFDEINCVMHLHTNAGIAVSIQEYGLRALSQTALFAVADLGYHEYEGVALNEEEKPRLVADLGDHNFLILRNHGTLTVGGSVGEAFLAMYILQRACEIQVMAASGGGGLTPIPDAILQGILKQADQVTLGQGGALVWPALLRKAERLDPSFRH